jgi:hypothetical protein
MPLTSQKILWVSIDSERENTLTSPQATAKTNEMSSYGRNREPSAFVDDLINRNVESL